MPPATDNATQVGRMLTAALLLATCAAVAAAPAGDEGEANALRAHEASLQLQLRQSPFGQPLVLESQESDGTVQGDAYARLPYPLATLETLDSPTQWCEVLILHLNVKACRPTSGGLALNVGRKFDQSLDETYRLDFSLATASRDKDYVKAELTAAAGPVGTRDYRILFEAVTSRDAGSFVHFRYAYGYGLAAHVAMLGYLDTVGSDKVGFSVLGPPGAAASVPIGGTRGAIERNCMRYYLALAAYLDSLSHPPPDRIEQRLNGWFSATERYPRQLHEIERDDYLKMKRHELGLGLETR